MDGKISDLEFTRGQVERANYRRTDDKSKELIRRAETPVCRLLGVPGRARGLINARRTNYGVYA